MENQREITWYIFTNDAYTNQVISRELPSENANDCILCFDGVERKLWNCDGQFMTKMRRNKTLQNLHFEIFKKEGKYGSVKKCDFFKKTNSQKIKKLKNDKNIRSKNYSKI